METPTTILKIRMDSLQKMKNVQQEIVGRIYARGKTTRVSYNDILVYMLNKTDLSQMADDIYREKIGN